MLYYSMYAQMHAHVVCRGMNVKFTLVMIALYIVHVCYEHE